MAAGVYECVLFWSGGAGQGFAYNVVHLGGAVNAMDQDAADAIAGVFIAAFTGPSNWNQAISDQITFQHVALKELTDPPGAQFIGLVVEQGTGSGDLMPPECSIVTSLRTAHPGRSGRGRIYNWGFSEAANADNGRVEDGWQTILNDGWVAVKDGLLSDTDFALAVYSRKEDEAYAVVSCSTNGEWDSQRRRKH